MEFEQVISAGEAGLAAMVSRREPESLNLEFKANSAAPSAQQWLQGRKLSDGARKVLGKALSGFANSAGGILILGVDARKNADGVDAAMQLVPFDQLALFTSLVTEAASDLLQPRHDGIHIQALPTALDDTKGYVVLDIPRSERRPHRCEAKDQKQYYKRTSGSTFAMEHYDIEDAFRRSSVPILGLDWRISSGSRLAGPGGLEMELVIGLYLKNIGDTTARHPSLVLADAQKHHLRARGRYQEPLQDARTDGINIFLAAGIDFVVNPGEARLFERLTLDIRVRETGELTSAHDHTVIGDILVPYELYAEDMRKVIGELLLSEEELKRLIGIT